MFCYVGFCNIESNNFFPFFFYQASTKVAVLGASGGIGQPLALLLKQSPLVSYLSLYDIVNTPGVAADLSHIETRAKVRGFVGPNELKVIIYKMC